MKSKNTVILGILVLVTGASPAVNFTRDGGDTNWSNLEQWNDNSSGSYQNASSFPTSVDTVLLNAGRVLTVDTNATVATIVVPNAGSDAFVEVSVPGRILTVGTLLVGINTHPGNGTVSQSAGAVAATSVKLRPAADKTAAYNFSGGSLTASTLNVGITITNATGTSSFIQSGGTVAISTANVGGAGKGICQWSGGSFDVSGNLNLNSNGCLKVVGAAASINVAGLAIQEGGELAFQLKASGSSAVQVNGSVDLSDVGICVEGSAYGGVATNVVLLTADTLLSMPVAGNITINGLADASIIQSDDSVVLSVVESQAVSLFENTVGDGLWGTAGNWSSGAVPSGAVHAVVGNGQVATISSNTPVVNAVTVGSNGTLIVQSGFTSTALTVEEQGTLNLELGMTDFAAVAITETATIDSAAQLVIEGADYEGFDGYFPLVHSSNLPSIITNATLTGFADREPSLVPEADGLWLRLVAPPALSERLCSLVPESTVVPTWSNSVFSSSRAYEPSGSAWSLTLDEAHVLDTRLSQVDMVNTNRSWDLRTGRGGFIYSLRTPALGETVPPSYRSDGNTSPWNDEVWQGVAVDSAQNNPPTNSYFTHQSGVYLKDPVLTRPFYSPQVASHLDPAHRSFTTVNWIPQAHINIYTDEDTANDFKSYLLMYTRYRDLGQGVIEVSLGYYNYGPDLLNFLNMPWGGVRRTSTEYAFVSEPGGGWDDPLTNSFGPLTIKFRDTGGWIGYSATPNGSTPTMAMVFGEDHATKLPSQKFDYSTLRPGYAGGSFSTNETNWRNYFVTSIIRWYNLSEGNGLWTRYYFALGDDLAELESRIVDRNLVGAQLAAFDYTEAESPLVAYSISGSGTDFQILENGSAPDFFLYAHPVSNSGPVFEVVDGSGARYLTWNPYANSIIKPYDGSIANLRLLGFAMQSAGTNGTYAALAGLLPLQNYFADGKTLFARTATQLETWRVEYFGFTDDAGDGANTANPDGDSVVNLWEYGFGGDPTNETSVGHVPSFLPRRSGAEEGVVEMEYIYARRIGSESELDYYLELATDLPAGNWINGGYAELLVTGTIDSEFEAVTNRIDITGKTNEFIRLKIEEL